MQTTHNKRDRHDILVEILETAQPGVIKTHIMYKARLSYGQLNQYVTMLVQKGLLEQQTRTQQKRKQQIYKTSQLGKQYIKNFKTYQL